MEIEFIDREEMYSVRAVGVELFLCVVVGGVGLWDERIPMDEVMTRQFRENPCGLLPWVQKVRRGSIANQGRDSGKG